MRIFLLILFTTGVFFTTACSRNKSSARMYEGDEAPNLKMFREDPGSPIGGFKD